MTRIVTLSEIGIVKTGKTPSKNNPEFWGDKVGFITPSDFTSSKYVHASRRISQAGVNALRNVIIPRSSVLVTCIGSDMGKVARVEEENVITNQQINTLIVNAYIADVDFIYYSLKAKYELLRNLGVGGGSTMPIINKTTFEKIKIELPNLETQKKIANILGSLDEKIELNRRMNETLEQLGQALFRHYFVDNSEVDSWESGEVSGVVRIYSGFAFKSKDFDIDGRYGLVTIKNVQDGSFIKDCTDHLSEPLPDKTPEHVHLKSGDIILSLTGNVGRVCAVVGCDYLLNQRVAKLVSDESQAYAYFLFRSRAMKDRMVGMSKGTAQKNLSPIETGKLKIKIPPTNTMSQFEENAIELLNMIVSNNEQIQTLTNLRGLLLPKLISGDIIL